MSLVALTLGEARPRIRSFVEALSNVPDLQFDAKRSPALLFDPYDATTAASSRIAHYFLMISSIDAGFAIGRPEDARRLGVYLHSTMQEAFFTATYEDFIPHLRGSGISIANPDLAAHLLGSVNSTVRRRGEILAHAAKHQTPREFAEAIADDIPALGGPHTARKRIWMYLRWMVRNRPDLRIFRFFDPRELYVPLDRNVARVGVCLGLLDDPSDTSWPQVEKVTEFARSLFPDDPAKVDYAFFLAGREMGREALDLHSLLSIMQSMTRARTGQNAPRHP